MHLIGGFIELVILFTIGLAVLYFIIEPLLYWTVYFIGRLLHRAAAWLRKGQLMFKCELHLEGCNGPVMWQGEADAPPRVVIYGDRVWHFYRYRTGKIPGNRAATYRLCTSLRLVPDRYKGPSPLPIPATELK